MLEFEHTSQKKRCQPQQVGPTAFEWDHEMEPQLDDLLRRAAAAQRVAVERALAELDLTPAQFAVLRLVVAKPGVSAAEAARIERLTPPTMSVIVANLERSGALARLPHPDNARIQKLEATQLGRQWNERGLQRIADWRNKISHPESEGELHAVASWLSRVADIDI